jgi:sugar transport system substrate-binding protein
MSTTFRGRWQKFAVTAVALAVGTTLAACGGGSGSGSAPASSAQGSGKQYTIGVTTLFDSPVVNDFTSGMKAEADKRGITLKINSSDRQPAKEASLIDAYITQSVDAILVDPLSESGSIPAIQRAVAAGITVICYDTCIKEDARAANIKGYVTADQKALGKSVGDFTAKYISTTLGGKAKIGILGCDQSYAVCAARLEGFKASLAPGSYDIVSKQEALTADQARTLAGDMLTANPDMNLLFAEFEGETAGASLAVKASGRTNVKVVGNDITPQIAGLLAEPNTPLIYTVTQDAKALGSKAVELAVDALEGKPQSQTQTVSQIGYSAADDQAAIKSYLSTHGG